MHEKVGDLRLECVSLERSGPDNRLSMYSCYLECMQVA